MVDPDDLSEDEFMELLKSGSAEAQLAYYTKLKFDLIDYAIRVLRSSSLLSDLTITHDGESLIVIMPGSNGARIQLDPHLLVVQGTPNIAYYLHRQLSKFGTRRTPHAY